MSADTIIAIVGEVANFACVGRLTQLKVRKFSQFSLFFSLLLMLFLFPFSGGQVSGTDLVPWGGPCLDQPFSADLQVRPPGWTDLSHW
jgi:hypothetical protein